MERESGKNVGWSCTGKIIHIKHLQLWFWKVWDVYAASEVAISVTRDPRLSDKKGYKLKAHFPFLLSLQQLALSSPSNRDIRGIVIVNTFL